MNSRTIPFLALLALTPTAFAQVTLNVNEPIGGSSPTYTSPITVSAKATSPNGPSGWDVYIDNQLVSQNQATTGILDTTVTATTGTHSMVITAFDNSGAYKQSAPISITVTANPLPTVPTTATSYLNLQSLTGFANPWTPCSGSCSGSSGSGSTPAPSTASTPSLSGSSLVETSNGTYWNTLFYRHLGCPTPTNTATCNTVQNMLEDVWFEPTSTTNIQQLEFDPDLYDTNNYEYFGSVACRLEPTNQWTWYLWNMSGSSSSPGSSTSPSSATGTGTWVPTPYACTPTTIQGGVWHHLQLYVTYNTSTQQYAYQTLVFDGATVFTNLNVTYHALQLPAGQTPTINIEQQIDNNSNTNATSTVHYDNYNLWVW
jgi:hypothetical protein